MGLLFVSALMINAQAGSMQGDASSSAHQAKKTPADSLGEVTHAELLTPVMGSPSENAPQAVKILVTEGPAKGCVVHAKAFLNVKRKRYEYQIDNPVCEMDGQFITVGTVVRGQHRIVGTMANSGMGRDYLLSKKGLSILLTTK